MILLVLQQIAVLIIQYAYHFVMMLNFPHYVSLKILLKGIEEHVCKVADELGEGEVLGKRVPGYVFDNVSLKFNVIELSLHSLLHEDIAPNKSKDDNDKHNKFFDFILINSFL